MPIDAEEQLRPHADHVVHFFDSEAGLIGALSRYLTVGAREGDGIVIIATADHRERCCRALAAAGIDVAELEGTGRLQVLDAADTIDRFRSADGLDPDAFRAVVGGVVGQAAGSSRHVRAYGEMVALLWDAGDVSGAMELERLWNDLASELPLTLHCGYPAHLFHDSAAAEAFVDLCGLHSAVVGGAPDPAGCEAARRLPRTPHAARLARQFVRETLKNWSVPDDVLDDALLVVSELVTNVIQHAASDVTVGLARIGGGVRVTVADGSERRPEVRALRSETLNGRGLAMVGSVARAWGHQVVDGGKLVWADLATDERGGEA